MKILIIVFLALMAGACSKQGAASRDAQEKGKPGYQVAKAFCSGCHTLPFGDQHPPAAWPYVVSRMERYMESAHAPEPNEAERQAIIGYFQGN